jgi:hypothetical protein
MRGTRPIRVHLTRSPARFALLLRLAAPERLGNQLVGEDELGFRHLVDRQHHLGGFAGRGIVAAVHDWRAMLEQLARGDDDISVLEIRAFVAALTAELTKASRVAALKRLYELLDRCQNEIALVNSYVERLRSHGIAN